jgi:hypothetical protein
MNALAWTSQLLAAPAVNDLLNVDSDNRFALYVIIIGCITGVISTIVIFTSSTINSIHRRRVEAEMKRDMIERGMSADEIAKIIEAASPPEDGTQRWIASWGNKKK